MINLFTVIQEQFPDFVRADYPAFVEFVSTYYKWLEIQSTASNLKGVIDIDTKVEYLSVNLLYNALAIDMSLFTHQIIVGVTSGAKAIVRGYKTETTSHTFYIEYITVDIKFINNETFYVEKDLITPANNIIRATILPTNAVGAIPTLFVNAFKKQLDVYNIFDGAPQYNVRLLKNIRDIYLAKGSEQALVYVLQTIHGAPNTVIRYPSEQILRSSDGRWQQESFITVSTNVGTFPTTVTKFTLFDPTQTTSRTIVVTRFEQFSGNIKRLYFNKIAALTVDVGQVINIVDQNNAIVFVGVVIASPNSININVGGAHWQLGQLITLDGSEKDSLARVTSVDDTGKILKLEIIDYGYNHANFQTFNVSPYPSRPLTRDFYDLTTTVVNDNPVTLTHSFVMADSTAGTYETMKYTKTAPGPVVTITSQQLTSTPPDTLIDYNLTMSQWQQSKAVIYFKTGGLTTLPGAWADNKGQLSNEYIRLEDNYYYQQFSYVIDSDAHPDSYIQLTNKLHPAGLLRFTNYGLIDDFATAGLNPDISLQIFPLTLNLFDTITIVDTTLNKTITRVQTPETIVIDDVTGYYAVVAKSPPSDVVNMTAAHVGTPGPTISYFDVVNYMAGGDDYTSNELILNIV